MEFAKNARGERIHASNADKIQNYFCPICCQKVKPKQGKIKAEHFAHEIPCEDSWHYDMSEWHSQWQAQFPVGNREIVVTHLSEKHRADVVAYGYVIEFQHSPITAEEFEERNSFYLSCGKKVIWIFDFVSEYSENQIEWYDDEGNLAKYKWRYPVRFLQSYIPQHEKDIIVFFQMAKEDHTNEDASYIERVTWAIEEYGVSNFKRFQTSYSSPGNAIQLLQCIKERKL